MGMGRPRGHRCNRSFPSGVVVNGGVMPRQRRSHTARYDTPTCCVRRTPLAYIALFGKDRVRQSSTSLQSTCQRQDFSLVLLCRCTVHHFPRVFKKVQEVLLWCRLSLRTTNLHAAPYRITFLRSSSSSLCSEAHSAVYVAYRR